MLLKDVISLAKYSELAGAASKDNIDAIIAFINLGVLELYKRFPIRTKEYLVTLEEGVTDYPTPDDFMYATEAFGEVPEGYEGSNQPIAINDDDDDRSIFFPDWRTVQIPYSVAGAYISIIYVAKPEGVTVTDAESDTLDLDIPDVLVDCLLSYIGYRAHLGIKSDAQSENNAQWARFERNCRKAIELGVAHSSDSMEMTNRLNNRGFV